MPRQYTCEYGSCQQIVTPIIVAIRGVARVRFCTMAHLALWARTNAKLRQALEADKISVADQIELGLVTVKEVS